MGKAEKDAVLQVMETDVLSAFIAGPGKFFLGGEKVQEFEKTWAREYGFRHAVSVNSLTTGLITAIGALGISPGDEVICTPYSMSASVTCAIFYGGIPVFADIDPNSLCLDPGSVEAKVTERTKAIVVVHLAGYPAEMDSIMEIARMHNLKVVEDAAQAPGTYYRGRALGGIGDIGGFSLNYHKHIHTGEGGMMVTNDDDLAQRCRLIRNHGEALIDAFQLDNLVNVVGSNYRLTEIQAAIGIEQLKRLPGYLEVRQELAAHLSDRLSKLNGLITQTPPPAGTHAYYLYPFRYRAEATKLPRGLFLRAVLAELPSPDCFESTPLIEGYVKPLYLNKIFQEKTALGRQGFPFAYNSGVEYRYDRGLCPVAERMYEKELLLSPLVREPLTTADLDDLADAMEKVLENAGAIGEKFSAEFSEGSVFTGLEAVNKASER